MVEREERSWSTREQIHHGPRYSVFRVRDASGRSRVLKTVRRGSRARRGAELLVREHAMLVRVSAIPGISRVIAIEDAEGERPRLWLEDAGPRDLKSLLRRGPLAIDDALRIAVDLTEIVALLHRAHVLHRDINPTNVVVSADARRITLVDFDLATDVPGPAPRDALEVDVEGTLLYVAPEQTGRLDRVVDQRADLYALGATFYEMLTGGPPFALRDPVELVHAHLARAPLPPSELRAEIPRVLSDVVLKLLAKVPEQRYQSADSLLADLREARARWDVSRAIEPFELARLDVARTIVPEGRIYGREHEISLLEGAFERARQGARETVMITGPPGIGKTALVHALRARARAVGGHFGAGKLDPVRGNAPYAPVIEAIDAIVRELVTSPDGTPSEWRARIADAVGANARVITDLVPGARALLGEPPALEPVAPADAETRFDLTFEAFVQALATPESPLVLFVDDLHWADAASLRVIELLATSTTLRHVMLVGAYRSEDGTADPPLGDTFAAIREHHAPLRIVLLGPIERDAVAALCADALHASPDRADALAAVVHRKTAGNPFYVERFLRDLHQRGLLALDVERAEWSWSAEQIAAAPMSENVVELMLDAVRRLPTSVQRVLGAASCFKRAIDVDLLARLVERPEAEIAEALWTAVEQSLLVAEPRAPLAGDAPDAPMHARDATYRFAHDRVQQAMGSLLDDAERQRLHLRLGRLLGEDPDARDQRLFDRVDHLNRGAALMSDDERIELAALNLAAGRAAKAASAFGPALAYHERGVALLAADPWRTHPELCFALHRDAAEAAYVVGDHERAEALVEAAIRHAPSRFEKAALYSLRLLAADARGAYREATRWGREGLRILGVELPEDGALVHAVDEEVAAVAASRRERSEEELIAAPPMRDRDALACVQLLDDLAAPTFYSSWRLHVWIRARTVRLVLDHGNVPPAGIAYATYGKVMEDRGDAQAAHSYIRLGAVLSQRWRTQKSRALTLFAVFMNHWRAPLRSSVPLARRAIAASSEVGDSGYAARTRAALTSLLYLQGTPLGQVLSEVERAAAFCRRLKQQAGTEQLTLQRQMIRCLQGRTRERGGWEDDEFDEVRFAGAFAESPHHECAYHVMRLETSYLLGDLRDARARMHAAGERWRAVSGLFLAAQYVYVACLTRAALADVAPEEREALLVAIDRGRERLRRWAENCPPNFAHKHDLVAAEAARLREQHVEATSRYEAAISGARREGFEQDEALASELAARYYRGLGQRRIASFYLEAAMDAYARWGATAKVEALEEETRELGVTGTIPLNVVITPPSDQVARAALDRLGLFEAAETISSEVSFEGVVEKLMRVCLATAGAQRGVLVLEREGALEVRAAGAVGEPPNLEVEPLRTSDRAPTSLVEHAFRSGEVLVLAHAAHHVRFGADAYVASRQTKSALAMPIQRQGRTIGVLYLENDLVTRAFTAERVQVLRLLSSQIAISLENSRLFEDLRLEVGERARAERRLRFLSEASVALARSLDWDATAACVAKLAVPFLGDWSTLDVVRDGGSTSRVAEAHADERREARLGAHHDHERESRPIAAVALRTGEPLIRRREDAGAADLESVELGDAESVVAVPLRARDRVVGVLTIGSSSAARMHDEADLSLAQELAHRAANSLENARLYREAEDAVRLRDEFLSIASHELRTPLASLQLAVQGLPRMLPPTCIEDARRVTALVTRQVHRLDSLIGLLLDVSRIRRGRLQLDRQRVDLREIAREAMSLLAQDLSRSGSELVVRAEAPVVGCWDGARLEQVLINLLGNAIKFGRGGRIHVSVSLDGELARVVVEDHGIGIPREVRDHVFEPFRRGVSSRHYGGLGLGLFITKTIIEEHGGRITVASEVDQGTTFTVELPTTC
ncbi:AAA family ATPase [Sandaracinus amylolyticus]|uniref:AAA family ATPase n=1 Tax=Sandaracinus amylolyticus TaxID=927083 RepID=UPI00146FEE29|nr:AAA family ATPase [Sandaracinus amylolyticus]